MATTSIDWLKFSTLQEIRVLFFLLILHVLVRQAYSKSIWNCQSQFGPLATSPGSLRHHPWARRPRWPRHGNSQLTLPLQVPRSDLKKKIDAELKIQCKTSKVMHAACIACRQRLGCREIKRGGCEIQTCRMSLRWRAFSCRTSVASLNSECFLVDITN